MAVTYQDVIDILRNAVSEIVSMPCGLHFNERYLHHYFSREIQKKIPIHFSEDNYFHPEWSTTKNNPDNPAKYKRDGVTWDYHIDENGSSGFIDFAIGPLSNPTIAIEFKMSNSFDTKGVAYDYLKLLDSRNPFEIAVSLVIVYGLSPKSTITPEKKLDKAYEKAKTELSKHPNRFASDRRFHFIVVAIDTNGHFNGFERRCSDGCVCDSEFYLDF